MSNRLRSLFRRSPVAGFTLTELLIAIALTSLVVALTGQGVVAMLQSQNKIDSDIARRTNLNRSLEFIADEMRMARSIAAPVASTVPTQTCGTATGVLNLTLPDNSTRLYYVHDLTGCSSSLWLRPGVIRRVERNSSGTLVSDTVLVDGIATSAAAPAASPGCTSVVGGSGFYACIASNGRTATVDLFGLLENALGNATTTPYRVTSQVTARSF